MTAPLGNEDVCLFDVPVDETCCVNGRHSLGHLTNDGPGLGLGHDGRTILGLGATVEGVEEVATLTKLRHDDINASGLKMKKMHELFRSFEAKTLDFEHKHYTKLPICHDSLAFSLKSCR